MGSQGNHRPGEFKWGVCTGDSLLFRRAGRHLRWWVTPALRASNREGAGATRPPSRYPGRIGETRAFFGRVPGSGEIGSCNNDPVVHARAPARFCHVNGPYSPVLKHGPRSLPYVRVSWFAKPPTQIERERFSFLSTAGRGIVAGERAWPFGVPSHLSTPEGAHSPQVGPPRINRKWARG